jgi:hypothetical protein
MSGRIIGSRTEIQKVWVRKKFSETITLQVRQQMLHGWVSKRTFLLHHVHIWRIGWTFCNLWSHAETLSEEKAVYKRHVSLTVVIKSDQIFISWIELYITRRLRNSGLFAFTAFVSRSTNSIFIQHVSQSITCKTPSNLHKPSIVWNTSIMA